jgi:hypothetical protein
MLGRVGALQSWTQDRMTRHRALIGRFLFELVIVFVGVTAAFALEDYREGREERQYRERMVGGLRASLNDIVVHQSEIEREIDAKLAAFDLAIRRWERPAPPVYREPGGERPPVRVWEGLVATGAARSLEPELFFRLARFYGRADSSGDRYQRYNAFTEERVLPYLGQPEVFYDGGKLRPEYAAYVERLRDFRDDGHELIMRAEELRDALPR